MRAGAGPSQARATERVAVLDGLRGLCLVFMLMSHLQLTDGFALYALHPGQLGFVQSAQGFFFVSGLLVGFVHIRACERGDCAAVRRRLWGRALLLYGWNLGLLVAVLGLANAVPLSWAVYRWWLGELVEPGGSVTLLAALLIYQPVYLDILPQYIFFLLISPWLLRWLARKNWVAPVACVLATWLMVQLGAHKPLESALLAALTVIDPEPALKGAFNPLAWQIVFFSGLILGAVTMVWRLDWATILRPERRELVVLALVVLAICAAWRLMFTVGLMPDEILERLKVLEHRREFGVLSVLNLAAFAWVFAWLLVAAPRADGALRALGSAVRRLLGSGSLVLLGRHALPVFAFHVVLCYALRAVDWWYGPFVAPLPSLIALLAVASLAIPAFVAEALRGKAVALRPVGAG